MGRGDEGETSPETPIERIALIGDVGGHVSELASSLQALSCDTGRGVVPRGLLVVQVGDLVDRGPDSAGAVRLADRFVRNAGGRYVQLLGNHEGQRFAELHLKHAGPLPGETLDIIHRWWSTRQARLAVAVDTARFGPLLVTHAGLSPRAWRDIGAPASAWDAAARLDQWVGTDAAHAFTPPPDRVDASFFPGVTWGEPAELYAAWLAEDRPPPFGQVHGHASAWSWKHRRWRKVVPEAVSAAAVTVDADRCHEHLEIQGVPFVGIDPGHLEKPRPSWEPLVLAGGGRAEP